MGARPVYLEKFIVSIHQKNVVLFPHLLWKDGYDRMKNRVYCLYRVSTDKQVDYDNKSQADIPMQRKACHRFAEEKGWTIIHEEQEDGVSGHKVRAENRDKLQTIKYQPKHRKFDILL